VCGQLAAQVNTARGLLGSMADIWLSQNGYRKKGVAENRPRNDEPR